jgi:DNA-binding MarR family transcriptional regulator
MPRPPATRRPRESLGFLIADVARLMRRTFGQRLQGSSLTLAQARALVYLSYHEGVRQVELAGFLEVQPITLARLIDTLEAGGLVRRRADPADRRAYRLYLTSAATPQLEAIWRVAKVIRAEALRGLDEGQVEAALLALRSMRANLSP